MRKHPSSFFDDSLRHIATKQASFTSQNLKTVSATIIFTSCSVLRIPMKVVPVFRLPNILWNFAPRTLHEFQQGQIGPERRLSFVAKTISSSGSPLWHGSTTMHPNQMDSRRETENDSHLRPSTATAFMYNPAHQPNAYQSVHLGSHRHRLSQLLRVVGRDLCPPLVSSLGSTCRIFKPSRTGCQNLSSARPLDTHSSIITSRAVSSLNPSAFTVSCAAAPTTPINV